MRAGLVERSFGRSRLGRRTALAGTAAVLALVCITGVAQATNWTVTARAASAFKLSITPGRTTPGRKVVISTTPRLRCSLTLTLAGQRYRSLMRYGWIQITLPRHDIFGRVPVSVNCGGIVKSGSFTVHKP